MIYEGTLYGKWEALVTFQQMIVLCDADGIVDMTPHAIAARTSIPFEIISKGLEILSSPDPYSRSPEQDGRRIELIDAHRPWGWHIVNHAKYQQMQDADTIREQTRERVRKHRESRRLAEQGVTVTDGNASKRHTDTDTDTNTDTDTKETPLSGKPDFKRRAIEILNFLNAKTNHAYKPVEANLRLIVSRLREGFSDDDLRAVIVSKTREWGGNPDMAYCLRPKTLFGPTNFANYEGQLGRVE